MRKIYFVAFTCAILLGLASCLTNDDVDNRPLMSGYFTITGSAPNYKLIADDGTVVYPTATSVSEISNGLGFGNHKRIYFNVKYYPENMKTENDTLTIYNGDLVKGAYLIEMKTLSEEEATKAGILKEDSIYPINTLSNFWVANGYLTTLFLADYSINNGIYVTSDANLYTTDIRENGVTVKMVYNRHTPTNDNTITKNEGTYAYSFDISMLNIPGNDSVTFTFETLGKQSYNYKAPRSALNYAK